MISHDPQDRDAFQAVASDAGFWNDRYHDADRVTRGRILGQHHRQLLTQTTIGRRRLRTWLDAHVGRPIVVETLDARVRRIAAELRYFGDPEPFAAIVTTIAALPRPVADCLLGDSIVIVVGRSSNGWTAGPFPRLRPIVLCARRTDAELASTLRHEWAHRWLLEQLEDAPTAVKAAVARQEWTERVASVPGTSRAEAERFAEAVVAVHERQANALMVAWGAMAS